MKLLKNKICKYKRLIIVCFAFSALVVSCRIQESKNSDGMSSIKYYTCGMHPNVNVSVQEYVKGQKLCPICNMNLILVEKTTGNGLAGIAYIESKKSQQQSRTDIRRVTVPVEQLERAGIQSEVIKKRTLCKTIRTVGQIAYDPDMLIAQEELTAALESAGYMQEGASAEIIERADNLVESSKNKLRLLGLSDDQIEELVRTRKVQKGLILPENKMWVYGDIYEYEIGWVASGRKITVKSESFPGENFHGTISAIDRVVNPKTRSVKFRAEIDNPGLKLKPQMYVDVEIQGICVNEDGDDKVPAVPKEAIIDTGERKIIWVDIGNSIFEGREIEAGLEGVSLIDGDGRSFYPVFSGVHEGERVVTKGNFLIDSQSQITGVAASGYGGALGAESREKENKPVVHQH
ncbi:MAG: efflux RND transporter periplasmic adaptor subunit [Candidatus Omnitrophota bacterium]